MPTIQTAYAIGCPMDRQKRGCFKERSIWESAGVEGQLSGTFASGLSQQNPPLLTPDMPNPPWRRALRARRVHFLALGVSGWLVVAPVGKAESKPGGDTVKMDPVEVKSDPFRTLGVHGTIFVALTGETHMYINAVNPASPSSKNGLRADDEIVELAGRPVSLRTLFSFRRLVKDALDRGASFECMVRPYHRKDTHAILLQAMREPRHRWLPIARSVSPCPEPHDPMPQPEVDSMPDATWMERGCATSQAALESLFCAFRRGDVDRLAALLDVSHGSPKELSGLFQSLPDSGRSYYGRPERMLAALVDQEARPRWIRIRRASSSNADWTELEVTLQFWDDFDHRKLVLTYSFHRAAGEWKWVVSSNSIERYSNYYRGVPFELATPEAAPGVAWFFRSH
jgi:hypothetical protein